MAAMLRFTQTEIDLLASTADALTAYTGKPVIAEIVADADAGFEWVLMAMPLKPAEDIQEQHASVQVGGPGARFAGSCGGLDLSDGRQLDCRLLWGIQLSDLQGVRFIKVDASGDESAWSDDLASMLPFAIT